MIYNQKYSFLIRDSKDNYYKFNLNNNYLYIDEYANGTKKGSTRLDESIIDYSVDIDKTDTIHILYMCTDGNLKYKLYSSSNKTIISKINTKFYKVKFLTLKITFPNIHIFYMTCNNLNSNHWLISHSFWNGKKWTANKVCQCSANKFIYPYMIDWDMDNIYLFYSKNCNDLYAIKKFNLSFEKWLTLDDSIYIYPSHNTTFFINDNNKAIICYNASINKSIQILVKYKDLTKNCPTWSKPIMVSNGSENAIHPCIFCKNNFTYIMWISGDKVTYKKSANMSDWSGKNFINANVTRDNLTNAIFISNHPEDLKYKNTFTLFSLKNIPISIFDIDKHTPYIDNKFNKISNNMFNNNEYNLKSPMPSNTPNSNSNLNSNLNLNNDTTNTIKLKDNYIKQLSNIIVEKDSLLSNLKSQLENTKSQLSALENTINQHSEITKNLESKNSHLSDELKYFKETVAKYNELKSDLESKNNRLLSELKNSRTNIEVLTAQKNSIITELNKKINELTLSINTKDSSISELSNKLNSVSTNTEVESAKDAKILELENQLKYYTNRGFWKIFK